MLVLFTDFGWQGPYIGLLKRALIQYAPAVPIIDLFHDAPVFDSQGAAYLLAAYTREFPEGAVFVGVIDPDVGGARAGLIIQADQHFYIGPDNGLFDRVVARSDSHEAWYITWRPKFLSDSFHGRDLFAPVAAMLATGVAIPEDLGKKVKITPKNWPDELARIVYIDHFGNAMTGIRSSAVDADVEIIVAGHRLKHARTFCEVPVGDGFWYGNSSGLLEVAVNQGSAAAKFGLSPGDTLQVSGKTDNSIFTS